MWVCRCVCVGGWVGTGGIQVRTATILAGVMQMVARVINPCPQIRVIALKCT